VVAVTLATPVQIGRGHRWRVYIQFLDVCEKFIVIIVIVKVLGSVTIMCLIARR
jgi:hypothetical protein